MLHPEYHHDLLAPHDLVRHVPESHQVEVADALAEVDAAEAHDYFDLHGIDPMDCAGDELRLLVWHNLVHDADEDELAPGDLPLVDRLRRAGQLHRGAH